jgi:vancomycin aglycone glucosyltransferase
MIIKNLERYYYFLNPSLKTTQNMKVAIVINGTRGDVQPMLALATGLIQNGHEIIFCAPPENEELVKRYNCPFTPFGPNYREKFRQNANMKGGAVIRPKLKDMKKDIEDQIFKLPGLINGSDLLLGVGFVLGVPSAADSLNIPYRLVIFYPAILGVSSQDPFFSRLLFGFGRSMTNMIMKSYINKKRTALGLKAIKDVWSHWMGENVIAACDKELNPVRDGILFKSTQTAYMLLPSKNGLPENVENFINSGKAPVFISFGSNPISRPERFSNIFDEVSKATNQRLLISKGWADLPENNTNPNILYVDEVSFELLFPHLAAIVYHGGTGTMASAARAGIPQIAFPFMADQFENSKQVVKLGLGPKACDFKKLNSETLISTINQCVTNEEFKKNAIEISSKLKDSKGLELTIKLIEDEFKK